MFRSKLSESDVQTGNSGSLNSEMSNASGFVNASGYIKIPGSEPIQLDLEKLFLLSVSKENLDFK